MDGIIGEIRSFGFNYTPQGWLPCNGTTYPQQQYAALYSIIGTTFGGSATATFKVPNLSGKILSGAQNQIPNHTVGASGGAETITLASNQMTAHSHAVNVVTRNKPTQAVTGTAQPGNTVYLTNALSKTANASIIEYSAGAARLVSMNNAAITPTGQGLPHSNLAPFLAMNFCICYDGMYPSRT
ncbi:Microcystin-dependent protein [Chitinophaga sp. CF118]|uniref:phage tail protein n=1 Tax=Chitinophaga sp. CF118 TaxID=1884367 RepID=UPI0008EB69BA|nr:tail fiber protein [Chitinophaga sp. CF118]SFD79518.1 Microcystin-dependent protein [Chitinophaga sp. CF118]